MKLWRKLSLLVLVIGIWQIGQGSWIYLKAWLSQQLIENAWVRTDLTGDKVLPWPWADTWPVARLEVPRLGVSRYVLAGGHGRALAFGPGWLQGTEPPGGPGKSVISGHRDTHFRFLKALQENDLILVYQPGGEVIRYLVVSRQIHHESESWLLSPNEIQQMVLITCYPFDALMSGGELRYVVFATAQSSSGQLSM